MQLDHATTHKLALIKQVYSNAALQATNRYSASARLLAVIGFDWAAEGMIKAVLTSFKNGYQKLSSPFGDLITSTNSELQGAGLGNLPDASRTKRVHNIRNAAQHEGRIPTEQEVIECQVHVADFLEAACQQVWSISFQSVSMASLIRNMAYREEILAGESAFQTDDYEAATAAASIAAARLLSRLQYIFLGTDMAFSTDAFVRYTGHKTHGTITEGSLEKLRVETDTTVALHKMQDALLLSLVGISLRDHMTFLQIAGRVLFTADGKPHIYRQKVDPTRNDAEFALAYATELLIRTEDYGGNMLEEQ